MKEELQCRARSSPTLNFQDDGMQGPWQDLKNLKEDVKKLKPEIELAGTLRWNLSTNSPQFSNTRRVHDAARGTCSRMLENSLFWTEKFILGRKQLQTAKTVQNLSPAGMGHGVRVDGGGGGMKAAAADAASERLGFHLQPRHMPLDRKGHRLARGTKRPNSVACLVFHLYPPTEQSRG